MSKTSTPTPNSVLKPLLPTSKNPHITWGRLYGSSHGPVIASTLEAYEGLILLVTPDMQTAIQLEQELLFFTGGNHACILLFPDWETLPYDVFSPHEDIISQRLETLHRLPSLTRGVLLVPITTLMQRLVPRN